MSWFGSSKYSVFEEKIEEATAETIPNGDIDFATALEISDLIRSKQVPPKDSMRILKKRFMDAENVNLQKSAFKLIDFCIKNGGSHFITEIASKEFMDPLVIMIKSSETNESLKKYMLENLQTWSIMVSTNTQFDYINKTYKKLQDDGIEFPMINDFVDPNMIESKVAPEWQDSDACMMCSKLFTFINRKHHCRSCGGVFCGPHSDKTTELPELGITIPVRVCDNCYSDHKKTRKKNKHSRSSSKNKNATVVEDDDDIQAAIELSLKESTSNHPTIHTNYTTLQPTELDDEDEAMKQAIQASLQELGSKQTEKPETKVSTPIEESTGLYSNLMPVADDSYTETVEQTTSAPNYSTSYYRQPEVSDRITGAEERATVQFVDLVNKLKNAPSHQNTYNGDLMQLQPEVMLLHPKVSSVLSKEHQELEKLQAMYSQLLTVSKLYENIIQIKVKQEQEMLNMQHTRMNFQMPIQPQFTNHMFQHGTGMGNMMSPQFTYNQQPPVFQLQQTGGYQMGEDLNSLSYASIPPNVNAIPTGAPQELHAQHTFVQQPANSTSPVKPVVATGTQLPLQSPVISAATIDNLQYAPIPPAETEGESSETPIHSEIVEPVPPKEPEIVNLIDL